MKRQQVSQWVQPVAAAALVLGSLLAQPARATSSGTVRTDIDHARTRVARAARVTLELPRAESVPLPMAIRYSCSRPGIVALTICDPCGQSVRTLTDGAHEAGEYVAVWDGRDDEGRLVRGNAFLAIVRMDGRSVDRIFTLEPSSRIHAPRVPEARHLSLRGRR